MAPEASDTSTLQLRCTTNSMFCTWLQDSVSSPDYARQCVTAAMALAAILILLPMALPGGGDVTQGGYFL